MSRLLNQNTAVLLFNYSEKQKASIRRISPRISAKSVDRLIHKLNHQAKKVARQSKLSLFQFNATSKYSFEEQLYEAYQELFDVGFDNVIGISNDCPSLQEIDLLKSANALCKHELVLGPAKDGGLYLLGIQKGIIDKESFLKFAWQTEDLVENMSLFVEQHGLSSEVLEEKSDMDTVAEFFQAFSSHFSFLSQLKSQLLSYTERKFRLSTFCEFNSCNDTLTLRGPPIL